MNYFTIFAHGVDFDVDAYLKITPLTFDRVWHRGDLRGCPEFIQDQHPTSGLEIVLGPGQELSTHEQMQIAVEFLEQHEDTLKHLGEFPGVKAFMLGIHVQIPWTPNLVGFCQSPSNRLMYHALCTGVTPTFYILFERQEWGDDQCDFSQC